MVKGSTGGCISGFFKEWLRLHDLLEIWTYCNGNKNDYTFYSGRHKTYSRIDYVFISRLLINYTMAANIGVQVYADHAPVIVTWKRSQVAMYNWRLNSRQLLNQKIIFELKTEIKIFFDVNEKTAGALVVSDAFKGYVRCLCIKLGAQNKNK